MTRTNLDDWADQHPQFFRKKAGQNLAQPTKSKAKASVVPKQLKPPERAGDVLLLFFPLPPVELQPNKKMRLHHFARAKFTKAAREAGGFVALQGRAEDHPWNQARIDMTFWTGGRPDRDGCIGWVKAYLDALQDVGIIRNDSELIIGDVVRHTGKQANGRREVELCITRVA